MEGVVFRRFGGPEVLEWSDRLPVPRPAANQVLLRVLAAGVNPLDLRKRSGGLRPVYGGRFPQGLGHDVVGEVAALGPAADGFALGERVFGMADAAARPRLHGFAEGAACAAYCLSRADTLARLPAWPAPHELAALPLAALTALQGLRRAGARAGQRVLVIGATGGVGVYAVQLAAALGLRVAAVCRAEAAGLAAELGAAVSVDYRDPDWLAASGRHDIVFDAATRSSFRACRPWLEPGGVYLGNVITLPALAGSWQAGLRRRLGLRRQTFNWVRSRGDDLAWLAGLVEAGRLRPVVDAVFPLWDIGQAHRRLEAGKVAGKLVLSVAPGWAEGDRP
jgi:NADPH:quinone reductase-like Zn-dependent oxidoreductase